MYQIVYHILYGYSCIIAGRVYPNRGISSLRTLRDQLVKDPGLLLLFRGLGPYRLKIHQSTFIIVFINGPQIRDLDAPLPPPGFKSRSAPFLFHQKATICFKNNQNIQHHFKKFSYFCFRSTS